MSSTYRAFDVQDGAEVIRSRPCPDCYVCGEQGKLLYQNLQDRLFGAPGTWNLRRCLNPRCGMVWLDPMPAEEDLGKAYRSYYTHSDAPSSAANSLARRCYSRMQRSYLRSKHDYRNAPRERWDQIFTILAYLNPIRRESFECSVFYLSAKPKGRLLEVGCGSGTTLKAMQDLGWQVEGVDFDPMAVERARKKDITVHLGTLAQQKLPSNTFDAIAAVHLIEHIPDPVDMLRECRRLLKPGGTLVLITPNAGSWGHRFYDADWRGLEPPRHLRIFTPSALASLCIQAGFHVRECRSMVRASFILLASRILRQTGRTDFAGVPTWSVRLFEEMRSLAQWAGCFVDSAAGEEIVAIFVK